MRCPFCGYEYDQDEAQKTCMSCSLISGCRMTKCPRCGYEIPKEPEHVGWLKKIFKKGKQDDESKKIKER